MHYPGSVSSVSINSLPEQFRQHPGAVSVGFDGPAKRAKILEHLTILELEGERLDAAIDCLLKKLEPLIQPAVPVLPSCATGLDKYPVSPVSDRLVALVASTTQRIRRIHELTDQVDI
jgi:hypothetical protein